MIVEAIRRFIDRYHLDPCGIVVACSGGPDSTALLLGLAELRADGYVITCAHVNHHLRGGESDGDEDFVRALSASLKLAFHVGDGTLAGEIVRRSGVEGAAREVRAARLEAIRDAVAARLIATAHQKNDQAETVIMRMLSGSGLAGMRGIHRYRSDGVIRPLLDVTRSDIESFLASRGIEARLDRMNDDPRFLRNRVRAVLRSLEPAIVDDIVSIAEQAQELWPAVERALDEAERGCVIAGEGETRFLNWPEDPWLRQALLHRHIRRLEPASRDVSSRDLQRLAAGLQSIRRVSVTRVLELVRRGQELVLRRRLEATPAFELEIAPDGTVFIPEIKATISMRETANRDLATGNSSSQLVQLPSGAPPRFIVRNRRPGDRFQPLGMARDKKLKDFLIDRKIDAQVRDRIPLLIWNEEIVWVAGIEVSERFKVTTPAATLYEVMFQHGPETGHTDLQR